MTDVWDTVEITFRSGRRYDQPYLDVDLDVRFTGPNGEVITRPAFWDGGDTWRVRFTPISTGPWRYQTIATDETDTGLHAVLGRLDCASGSKQPGFLRRSAGSRFLEYADGRPFFWLGDTHWRFTAERWEQANKPGWTSQFRNTVDRRVAQGFTVYQANLMMFDWGATSSPYWLPNALFQTPDIEHFQRIVDPRMRYLSDAGLVVALGLGWYELIDIDPIGVSRFARYVVARYGAAPIVWTLGGEAAGYETERTQARLDGWRSVAETIRRSDGYRHPITVHSTNERPIAPHYQDEGWLTLTLNQHGHGDLDLDPRHYGQFFATHPNMPMVEGESLYEGLTSVEPVGRRTVTDSMVRHAAYRAIQSGCCGYSYGAQGGWNGAWDEHEGVSSWGSIPWYQGVDLPGGEQMGYLRRFYEQVGWSKLRPADCFTAGGAINARFNPVQTSANSDRSTIVVYFPETFRIEEKPGVLTGLTYRAARFRWYDPRVGAFLPATDAVVVDGTLPVPYKPDSQDWVLVAESCDQSQTDA